MKRQGSIISIIISAAMLVSCNSKDINNQYADYNGPISAEITLEEISIEPDSVCDNLPSYYESTIYVGQDGDTCILGYNYKTHELDILNLSSLKFEQPIILDRQGPNGITGTPIWFHQISQDSILIGSEEQTAYLIDSIGRVINSYSFRDNRHSTATRNARRHIATFSHDGTSDRIFFPREEKKNLSIAALDMVSGKISLVGDIPGWTQRKVGFMIYPNVAYTDSTAIINFPYECKVTEISLANGEILHQSDIPMTIMTTETVDPGESAEEVIWRSYANPFYGDVNYLPDVNMFAQIVIGPTNCSRNDPEMQIALNRNMYMRLFDRNLNPVYEYKFNPEEYYNQGAWLFTHDGVILYHDNPLDKRERTEGVHFTRFRVKPVYSD